MPLAFALTIASIAADSVITKFSQRIDKVGIVRGHHATLARSQMLDWMKTEDRQMGNATYTPASVLRAECVARIFDYGQATALSNFEKDREISGMSSVVDRQQSFRTRCD